MQNFHLDHPETRMLLRILLVDDDDQCHTMLGHVLASPPPLNFELLSALNLDEGIKTAEREDNLTCVLLDLSLPGVAREEVLAAIPRFKCPVVLFTGHGQEDVWIDAIRAGALECLQKHIYLEHRNRASLLHSILNAYFLHFHHPTLKKNGSRR